MMICETDFSLLLDVYFEGTHLHVLIKARSFGHNNSVLYENPVWLNLYPHHLYLDEIWARTANSTCLFMMDKQSTILIDLDY